MAAQEGNLLIRRIIEKHPVERDMDIAETGDTSGVAVQRSVKTTHVSFAAASEQSERDKNHKIHLNGSSEPVCAPGDWRSPMERIARQQARSGGKTAPTTTKPRNSVGTSLG
jgi:hypothetical protein